MVVVLLLAVDEVVVTVFGDAEAGTAANLIDPIAALLVLEVGPAPKPPRPSTRYPQLLAVSAAGVVWVPLTAAMVLPPEVRLLLAPDSPTWSV